MEASLSSVPALVMSVGVVLWYSSPDASIQPLPCAALLLVELGVRGWEGGELLVLEKCNFKKVESFIYVTILVLHSSTVTCDTPNQKKRTQAFS